ncbi:hypothetical protein Vadar_002523 [Vaccinium darrowii]|uniref:Uncharacterized protein n=1 Tax=Vaccinium darrowii TaxID=229202 RepID=A0ACB7ZGS8_9ERIC|nr:hypothetical protein Vadar_002523 [Vaccinium darrowii]
MDIVDQELERLHCPDPGPRDSHVLTMQDSHRLKRIWDNEENAPKDYETFHFRRVKMRLHRAQLPCEASMQLGRRTGLEGLVQVPFIQLDHALVTTLIERWRLETHSFHMGDAEMTVTLQDVEVILGLPVDGDAVMGYLTVIDVKALCTRLLSQVLEDNSERKGQKGATDAKEVTGPMVLVQIWAWKRLPILSPRRVGKRFGQVEGSPLIAKQTPYDDELIDSLPAYCSTGRAIWRAHVPLIFFSTIEMHQPERVRQQFGCRQHVPPLSEAVRCSHGLTLRNGPSKDWSTYHGLEVDMWNGRLGRVDVFDEPDLEGVYPFTDPYVIWLMTSKESFRFLNNNNNNNNNHNKKRESLTDSRINRLKSYNLNQMKTSLKCLPLSDMIHSSTVAPAHDNVDWVNLNVERLPGPGTTFDASAVQVRRMVELDVVRGTEDDVVMGKEDYENDDEGDVDEEEDDDEGGSGGEGGGDGGVAEGGVEERGGGGGGVAEGGAGEEGVHVDRKVIHTDHGLNYRGSRRIYFSIERGINFNTFKEMIIEHISGTEISMALKFPTLSYPNTQYIYTTIEVVNDDGVEMIFDMADRIPGYIPEVFTTILDCGNLSQIEERSLNRSH